MNEFRINEVMNEALAVVVVRAAQWKEQQDLVTGLST